MYTFTIKKVATLAATVAVASFLQAQEFEENNIKYEIIDANAKTVKVIDGSKATGEVEIPPRVANGEYTVVEIGDSAFRGNMDITGIIIPETVEVIGIWAFESCKALSSVEIPDGVTTIKQRAFETCDALERVTIPASVTTLENNVFIDCRALLSINVNRANPNYSSEGGVLFNKDKSTILRYPTRKAGDTYSIPSSVKTIGVGAFEGSILTQINIPTSVITIEEAAFINCLKMPSITIPNSVTTIGIGAFRSSLNLEEVNLPASLTSIGVQSFLNTPKLRSINVDANNQHYSSIDGVLFNKDQKTLIQFPVSRSGEYIVPNGVETIDREAFGYALAVTSFRFPSSLKQINRYAFFGTSGMKTISSNAVEPPAIENRNAFTGMPTTTTILKVPVGSKAKYEAKNVWKEFIIEEDASLSTNDVNSIEQGTKVYPNPTTGIFFVETTTATDAQIISISGQVVKSTKLSKGKNEINISNLSAGLYLVKVGDKTFKVLKK